MANPPSTNRVTDKLAKAGADDDATIEQFREVDTTRPLGARNGEHGHIDGPRGRQDFHRHNGGDQPHGHKRGHGLARTAGLDEWVPPLDEILAADAPQSAATEVDPPPAGTPGAMGAPEPDTPPATASVGSGDQAGAGRPAELDVIGEHNDKVIAAFVQQIAQLAEADRYARAYSGDVQAVTALARLVAVASRGLHGRQLVDADTIRQAKDTVCRWAEGRGVAS